MSGSPLRRVAPYSGSSAAAQCRKMKISVGDTIVGREAYGNGLWTEAKLTLIFLGREQCVWKVYRRSSQERRWRAAGEQSNWTLAHREWKKLP